MYLCLAGWSDTSLLDHDYCKKIDSEDIPLIDLLGEEPSSESTPNLGHDLTRGETSSLSGKSETPAVTNETDTSFQLEERVESPDPSTDDSDTNEKSELFKELMKLFNASVSKSPNAKQKTYSDAMRKFAITMFSYSPHAYRYMILLYTFN